MKKSIIKIVCLSLIIGLNWAGLSAIGETIAYFSDTENTGGNVLKTGVLDMTLRSGQNNFVPGADNMSPGKQVNRDIYVGETAFGLPLKHNVSFELVDGNIDLCNQLDLKIWYDHYNGPVSGGYANRDMRLTYNGKLSALSDYSHVDFEIPHPDDQFDDNPNNGIEQWFYYSIILPSGIADSFQGEVCKFNFVFKGWQDNIANYGDGGFSDIEKIESTIKTKYWNPPVVLNEFLPNAGNYPEFIEIYNKTGSDIDLDGFYIKANCSTIPIDATTTNDYSGGSTIIPANGWLVVTAGGDLINNSSGIIALYNSNNIEVDSYAYSGSDHNVNNTPGWTNNLVGYWPFDGDFEDKSENGNNGTNYGATSVAGKINQALSFDGQDDYVSIANSDDFDFGSGEFSVEFWTKTDSGSRQWLGTRYENYGPGWGLGTQNSHALGYIRTFESGTNKKEIEGDVNVADTNWHHLVMTRIGDKIKIYTDGSFEKEGTLAGDVNNDEPIEIGRISWSGGSQYFEGLIDEVKIYNRALDASEILEHYNAVGSSGAVPVDKSYARIPDGSGNWVDPIPTPGGPNILEPLQSQNIEQIENDYFENIVNIVKIISKSDSFEDIIESEEDVIEEEITEELINEPVEELVEEPVSEEAPNEEPLIDEELSINEEPIGEEVTTEENITEEDSFEDIIDVAEETVEKTLEPDQEDSDDEVVEGEISSESDEDIKEEGSVEEVPADETGSIDVEEEVAEEEPAAEEPVEEIIEEEQPAIEPEEIIIEEEENDE